MTGAESRRPPPHYDRMIRQRKPMLALAIVGVVAGLGFCVVSVMAVGEGRGAAWWLAFWLVVTLVNASSLRDRIATVRDPEAERRRLELRYEKVLSQPRRQLLVKAALFGFGLSLAFIALGLTIGLKDGSAPWLGWVLVVLGVGLAGSTAYRLRHPAFERD